MKRVAVGICVLLLSLFGFAAKKPPVQVAIQAPVQTVKEAAVATAVAQGYTIDTEGQFQIVFTREMGGARGFFTQALLSPPACTSFKPRHLFTMLFVPNGQTVTVTMYYDYEYASALCKPARQRQDDSKVRGQLEGLLTSVKTAAEQSVVTAKSEPAAPKPTDAAKAEAQPVTASTSQAAPTAAAAPAQLVSQPAPVPQQSQQEPSLGDVARKYREQKKTQEQQEQSKPPVQR